MLSRSAMPWENSCSKPSAEPRYSQKARPCTFSKMGPPVRMPHSSSPQPAPMCCRLTSVATCHVHMDDCTGHKAWHTPAFYLERSRSPIKSS